MKVMVWKQLILSSEGREGRLAQELLADLPGRRPTNVEFVAFQKARF